MLIEFFNKTIQVRNSALSLDKKKRKRKKGITKDFGGRPREAHGKCPRETSGTDPGVHLGPPGSRFARVPRARGAGGAPAAEIGNFGGEHDISEIFPISAVALFLGHARLRPLASGFVSIYRAGALERASHKNLSGPQC